MCILAMLAATLSFRVFQDIYVLRAVLGQALILAFLGVLICAILLCVHVVFVLLRCFDRYTGMMVGVLLAASDPVDCTRGRQELGEGPRLPRGAAGRRMNVECTGVILLTSSPTAVQLCLPMQWRRTSMRLNMTQRLRLPCRKCLG